MPKQTSKLYDSFQPEIYELDLKLSDDQKTVSGRVIITGKKRGRPSKRITLNQKNIKVISARLIKHDRKLGDQQLEIDRLNHHAKFQELRIHSPKILYPGVYTLTIEFVAPAHNHGGDNLRTLTKEKIAAVEARSLFPCIDEFESWEQAEVRF